MSTRVKVVRARNGSTAKFGLKWFISGDTSVDSTLRSVDQHTVRVWYPQGFYW